MNEIKFRLVKDGKTAGYERHILNPLYDNNGRVEIQYSRDGEIWHPINIGAIRCDGKMRFIGLTDKKGVEVYESDIVTCSMSFKGGVLPHGGKIVYDETFGAFGTKNESGVTLLHNHCLHTLEVMDETYANYKLLKSL